jgi:hypothetical protein
MISAVFEPIEGESDEDAPEFGHDRFQAFRVSASAAQRVCDCSGRGGCERAGIGPTNEAEIKYTPAHVVIGTGGVSSYDLDLNGDGITDFIIQNDASLRDEWQSGGTRNTRLDNL